ncbi:hypothetical protein CBR67_17710 [Bordetella hinzii]|uniref:site-specific integrase n=1 Tax=Bordetella hinzii TaxID=103855 RepID=UPI00114DB90A|nr:site-specific integrase [Bordetella hinzii]QDJ38370.1 hypothetical protein CBR67_17710 [Bordetella hinzii]
MASLPNLKKSRHGVFYWRQKSGKKETVISLRTKDYEQAKYVALQIHLSRTKKMVSKKVDDLTGFSRIKYPADFGDFGPFNPKQPSIDNLYDLKKLGLDEATIRKLDLSIKPDGTVELKNARTKEELDWVTNFMSSEKLEILLSKLNELSAKNQVEQQATEATQAVQVVSASPAIPKTKLFSKVKDFYLEEKKQFNGEKTLDEKAGKYQEFIDLFGDLDFNSIRAETAVSHKQRLLADGFSAERINKVISFFTDLFNYGIDNKYYYGENPYSKLRIKDTGKKRRVKSYLQFDEDELKTIFDKTSYIEKMASVWGKVKPEYYWLPLIALFGGGRLGEIAGLTVPDFKQEKGIWYYDITEQLEDFEIDEKQEAIKTVKNDNSIRSVPVHKKLIELGLISYIQSLKDKNGYIFSTTVRSKKNGYGKNMGRRFNEEYLRDKLGIKSDRKRFHSLRSTFINRMTYLNVHPAILQSIVGHYKQDKVDFSSAHFAIYQQRKPVHVMKEVIDHLDFPEIDFDKYTEFRQPNS